MKGSPMSQPMKNSMQAFIKNLRYLAVFALLLSTVAVPAQDKVSKPGQYAGYSREIFDGWVRSSQYVAVRDGTRLAVDLYRPAVNGQVTSNRYPVIWSQTQYRRASIDKDGKVTLSAETYYAPRLENGSYPPGSASGIANLTRYGYVVAIVDARGTGASFGWRQGMYDRSEALDGYDITEWLAVQPWSDGNVGMFGCSYLGGIQDAIAATKPPHLKAIFPGCADPDNFNLGNLGGIQGGAHKPPPGDPFWVQDFEFTLPVDGDNDKKLLAEATAEHQKNVIEGKVWASMPYRDSVSSVASAPGMRPFGQAWLNTSAYTYFKETNQADMAIYGWDNWQDAGRGGALVRLWNLNRHGKLYIGPWGHCQINGALNGRLVSFDMIAEHHRFFDRWLKGIDNGIANEPPIYYVTVNAPADEEWRFTPQWPVPGEKRVDYYMYAGENTEAGRGALQTSAPQAAQAKDEYTAAYDVTNKTIDEKGLTYTSAPFTADTEITGDPVVHLWVSSTTTDADIFVYLEDVDPSGNSTVVSDERLRASLRALSDPPYDNGGRAWHRSYLQDAQQLVPNFPVELVLNLLPLSRVFPAGHRLRLAIDCAAPGADFLKPALAYQVSIWRDAAHKSYVSVPFHVRPYAFHGTAKVQIAGVDYAGPADLYVSARAAYLNFGEKWLQWNSMRKPGSEQDRRRYSGASGTLWLTTRQETAKAASHGISFQGSAIY